MPGGWREREDGRRGDTRQTPSNGTHEPLEPGSPATDPPPASRPAPPQRPVPYSQPRASLPAPPGTKGSSSLTQPARVPRGQGAKPLMCSGRPEMLVPDSAPAKQHFEQGGAGGLWCFGAPAIQGVPEPARQQHQKPQRRPSSSRALSAGPEPARQPTPAGPCVREGRTARLS